jgi:hypothetical protein
MPFVFLSFTSRNGSFLPYLPAAMSLKCLFAPHGGAIAYIGSAYETYAYDNELLGQAFFSELKKNPNANLGALLARAKPKDINYLPNALTYFLLGDPALRVTLRSINLAAAAVPDSAPTAVRISLPDDSLSQINYSISFTVRDSVPAVHVSSLDSSMGFSVDSSVSVRSGVFQHSIIIPFPQGPQSAQKAIVYVWNDTADGRAEVTFGAGTPNAVISVYRNQAIAKTSLSIRQGNLVISNVKFNAGQVRIFDILGRVVYSGEFQTRSGNLSINLNGKNISPGRYLLQMRSGANEVTMPFMHMSR